MNRPRPLDELLAAAEEAAALKRQHEEARRKVGQQVKSFRRARGLSQDAFANQLGRSQSYLSQVENGERTPSPSTLDALIELANNTEEVPNDGTDTNSK